MLLRAVSRGSLANFNDVIAEQLVGSGLAVVDGSQLVPTELWPSDGGDTSELAHLNRKLGSDPDAVTTAEE